VLPAADAELVRAHVQNCTRCAALHATLCWLQRELPPLAAVQPDAQLTSDILSVTAGMRQRRTPLHHGVRDWFARLVARPRFAWEVAYVGTLIVVLLFGTSASPFRSVPERALAIIQIDPRDAVGGASQRLRDLHGGIGNVGARAWDATAGRALQSSRDAGAAYADQHPGMHDALADFRAHGGELRQHLSGRNFAGASLMLQAMGGDVRALWNSWTAPPPDARP